MEQASKQILPSLPASPPVQQSIDPHGHMLIPGVASPGFRRSLAEERGNKNEILIKTWGGLGDELCSIPTVTFALETFKGRNVSLAAMRPEFFRHLKFKNVYNVLNGPLPDWYRYYSFDAMGTHHSIPWDFICHIYINCVDANSLFAFRCQLPIKYKEIVLKPTKEEFEKVDAIIKNEIGNKPWILEHPGKHWESKTFPSEYYNETNQTILKAGVLPVIIGGHNNPSTSAEMTRTTVNIDTRGCLDLRCKLTLMETVALIQRSKVVLTNDSCIIHMAASSDAWCGFISLAKHPDYIKHWRHGVFGWRMENLSLGGLWETHDVLAGNDIMTVGDENMKKWLPCAQTFANWGLERLF